MRDWRVGPRTDQRDDRPNIQKIVSALQREDYVSVIRELRKLRGKSESASRTALRKLFETVNRYGQDTSASAQKRIAEMYGAVAHTASRRKDPELRIAKAVADRILVDWDEREDVRIERFIDFLKLLVATRG